MPFDPTLPQANTLADADAMRAQFNALFDLIQTGGGISDAQVDSVTTLDPGQPASASAGVVGQTLHFTFAIPRGDVGAQGPSFASAQVDAVTSLNPGDPAQASLTFDGSKPPGPPIAKPGEIWYQPAHDSMAAPFRLVRLPHLGGLSSVRPRKAEHRLHPGG